jgi:glutamyl-tRNA reductase
MTTDALEGIEPSETTGCDRPRDQCGPRRVKDAIAAICGDAERIERRELEEAIHKLEARGDLTEDDRDAVEAMADAIVGWFLERSTRDLRRAVTGDGRSEIDTSLRLFGTEIGAGKGKTRASGSDAAEVANDDD